MGIQIAPEFQYDLSEAVADGENRLGLRSLNDKRKGERDFIRLPFM